MNDRDQHLRNKAASNAAAALGLLGDDPALVPGITAVTEWWETHRPVVGSKGLGKVRLGRGEEAP